MHPLNATPTQQEQSSVHGDKLWIVTVLLWIIWAIRAYRIMALPVFVDESLHILRAQMVFNFSDATSSFLPGKLLLYYYLGLFDPQDVGGAWISRQAVALLVLPGAALTYRLSLELFGRHQVGLWALFLYSITPFLVFFERMALADTFVMVWGLALALFSVRFARYPTTRGAVVVGVFFALSLLAKLTALPWLVVPPLAIWLYGKSSFAQLKRHLMLMTVSAGLILLLPVAFVFYQELAPDGEKQEVVTTVLFVPEDQGRLDQVTHNIETYYEASVKMFTAPLLVLMGSVATGLFAKWIVTDRQIDIRHLKTSTPKHTIYLLSITLSIWGFVVFASARPSTRYLVVGVPFLLIIAAVALNTVQEVLSNILHCVNIPHSSLQLTTAILTASLLMPWGWQSLNFIDNAWYAPTSLDLAERDIWEYYQNSASGYALREAAKVLPTLPPLGADEHVRVAGFVGACHTLRLYLPGDNPVAMVCPYFKWRPEFADQTLAEWAQRISDDGTWYVLADDEQPIDLTLLPVEWELLATFPRPHNGIATRLFRVTAQD